ncbi:MAG: geranylgeranylglyceryl/heptaprenylglyceryl phosphate synthase [Bacteroidota bacterium]
MFNRDTKCLALLIDPENTHRAEEIAAVVNTAEEAGIDFIFVGGSLVTHNVIDEVVKGIKSFTQLPVILFPGGLNQISKHADGILFLSLISGRNPEFLISKQVAAAPLIKKLGLEVIPTGYLLIGETSSASYMSNTRPIPYHKTDIATATSLAGELMGKKAIYMDAGSGASEPIRIEMISAVRNTISLPLIVGGGIRSFDSAYAALEAGADVIVVGNAAEKNPQAIKEIAGAVRAMNSLTKKQN